MATPKKRTGKASQNSRRANWKGSIPATTTCPNCSAIIPTHTVCPECGYYKNGIASIKKQRTEMKVEKANKPATVETPVVQNEEANEAEVKKTRKPRAKKAETEEVKEEKPKKATKKSTKKEESSETPVEAE